MMYMINTNFFNMYQRWQFHCKIPLFKDHFDKTYAKASGFLLKSLRKYLYKIDNSKNMTRCCTGCGFKIQYI